jgi:DNA-binding transcriptional MerR regulator
MPDPHLRSLAQRSGLTARELARYVELDLISEPPEEESESTLLRMRRIRRLQRDLDIDLEVVAIIMRLLDRIQELEAAESPTPRLSVRVLRDES